MYRPNYPICYYFIFNFYSHMRSARMHLAALNFFSIFEKETAFLECLFLIRYLNIHWS
jgi:hypothetical protein